MEDVSVDVTGEAIPAPPDHVYASYEDAYSAFKSHGMKHGYGFHVEKRLPRGTDIKTRYYFQCDRARKYKSKATIRKTSTRTTGCLFRVVIFKMKTEENDGQWRLETKNGSHNHPRSLNASTHHVFRKRTATEKETIAAMSRAGVRPIQILTALKQQNEQTLVTGSDIRGERLKIRTEHLNGRSPIETLLDDLTSSEWVFDVKRDSENRVQNLFFAHSKQIEILRANPDVLLMDCTYRTNKYRLPLLHIVGCTNLQTFFSAGFCFLRTETDGDYYWALSTFLHRTHVPQPRVFISDDEDALKSAARALLPRVPQLLCVWHINKNVLTQAQLTWRTANGSTKEEKAAISDQRAQFMKRWNQVCSRPSVKRTLMKPPSTFSYVNLTELIRTGCLCKDTS